MYFSHSWLRVKVFTSQFLGGLFTGSQATILGTSGFSRGVRGISRGVTSGKEGTSETAHQTENYLSGTSDWKTSISDRNGDSDRDSYFDRLAGT